VNALQQQHAAALDQQRIANEEQVTVLRTEIDNLNKMLQNQVQDAGRIAELEKQLTELNVTNQRFNERNRELEIEVERLKGENQDLEGRIIAATGAIIDAVNKLNDLNNPNDYNEEQLNAAFAEILQSIQTISSEIQGRGNGASVQVRSESQAQRPPPELPQRLPGPPFIGSKNSIKLPKHLEKNENISYNGTNNDVKTILKNISKIYQKPNTDFGDHNSAIKESMLRAWQEIYDPKTTVQDIPTILRSHNIIYEKNGVMKHKLEKSQNGGKTRKIRKYKKQKGGFTYRPNAKRKRLTTSLFSRNRTRSSRTRSSNRSSRRSSKR